MALKDMAGGAARMTAGFWKEVARAIDPPPREAEKSSSGSAPAPESPSDASGQDRTGPDGVLVPLDTWTRVMEQLGNLHEAGQELAEARERAARAETEAEFLREQLRELKARQRRPAKPKPPPATAAEPVASAADAPRPAQSPLPASASRRAAAGATARAGVDRARQRLVVWLDR